MTLQEKIEYEFNDVNLLTQALTHKSHYNENKSDSIGHNERLEFLGDAVLDLCLSVYLMESYPDLKEGELSKLRASLVNEIHLAEIAKSLELQEFIRLGKGEHQSKGSEKPRLLASAFEALVGAYFLDATYDHIYVFIKKIFKEHLKIKTNHDSHFPTDYKSHLQEKLQELHKKTPVYKVLEEEGPDHIKTFRMGVFLDDKLLAEGRGKSKKQAEQEAAKKAMGEFK